MADAIIPARVDVALSRAAGRVPLGGNDRIGRRNGIGQDDLDRRAYRVRTEP